MKEDPKGENTRFQGKYGEKIGDNEMCIDKLREKQQKEQTKKHRNKDEIGRSTKAP